VVKTTDLTCDEDTRVDEPALLVVDAPNVDAVHGGMLGRSPRRGERFDPAALSLWAAQRVGGALERTLFTNVPDPVPAGVEGWIKYLVDEGWRVYAKPKRRATDDIDDAMVGYLGARTWRQIVVFSHDSACFAEPLTELQLTGISVTVVGFRECAGRLPHLDRVTFVDVDDVPGLYRQPPPRVRLVGLPVGGGWIERVG
jgi:uncharacterized protein